MTFDRRKKELLEKSGKGAMRIDIAKDANTRVIIGYCISTISEKKQGEIESIFIEEDYRRHGIGDNFMEKTLAWMDSLAVVKKIIAVAAGNEEALIFYSRHNFYPKVTILQNNTSP